MEKHISTVGERVEKYCEKCGEERGHVVALITKAGRISRVECPKCHTRSPFKAAPASGTERSAGAKSTDPYDQKRTYRSGQRMLHPTYGSGEVTAVLEAQKIDVLFSDRLRRMIHART